MLPEVIEVVTQAMSANFGNPSSVHQFGRKAKSAIETARKNIAKQFNVKANEIIFTSGGTEADNLILHNAVVNLGVQRIITSKTEHNAVLNTVAYLQKTYPITVEYVNVDEFGSVNLEHLEEVLQKKSLKTIVSLMMVNNEIGTILPIYKVGELCIKYDALFHSDAVQAIGRYKIDLQHTAVDFMVASAHKFHGPKGVGFFYANKKHGIYPMFHGGNQEKGARSGTENVCAILGMEKALELAYKNLEEDTLQIKKIKKYFIEELLQLNINIQFNGVSSDLEKSSNTILNVRFPIKNEMLLFNFDLAGIAVSGGSACQSGSVKGSHVLASFLSVKEMEEKSVRFSFSKLTTKEEIDSVLLCLKNIVV